MLAGNAARGVAVRALVLPSGAVDTFAVTGAAATVGHLRARADAASVFFVAFALPRGCLVLAGWAAFAAALPLG